MKEEKIQEIKKIFIKNNGYARTKDITSKKIHSSYIYKLEEEGTIIKVKRGLYMLGDYDFNDKEELIQVSKIVPEGVVCLLSALSYYELTTYNPWEYQIAIHRDSHKSTLPEYPPIKLVYFSETQYNCGIENIEIHGHKIKIYDIEKTICDVVRYRNKIGIDIMKESLHNYIYSKNMNISKLMNYAEKLCIKNNLKEYLEVLI